MDTLKNILATLMQRSPAATIENIMQLVTKATTAIKGTMGAVL